MALHVEMVVGSDPPLIEAAVESLVLQNVELMKRRSYPPLYSSGIRYREEPQGQDDWKTVDRTFADGVGDCEDVGGIRAAELRCMGDHAAKVKVLRIDESRFHAVVQRGDGVMEDPSRILIALEVIMQGKPTISVREVGEHCLGSVSIPMLNGQSLEVQNLGFDAWSALTSTLDEAWSIVSDPRVSVWLPPQAQIAIGVGKAIANMKPDELKALVRDPKATDAQRALASKMLEGKAGGKSEAKSAKEVSTEIADGWSILPKASKQSTGAVARTPGALWTPATAVAMNVRDHRPGGSGQPIADPNRQTATYQPPVGPVRNMPPTIGPGGAPPAGTPDTTTSTAPGVPGMTSFPPGSLPPTGIPGMTPPGVMPGGMPGLPGMPGMPGLQVVSLYNPNGMSSPGYVWVDNGDGVPAHWERPHAGWPTLTPQMPVIYPQLPNYGLAPAAPTYPGYPGYPMAGGYGYPGGYPMPGWPSPSPMPPYPYMPGAMPSAYPYSPYDPAWGAFFGMQPVTPDASPLTPEEQLALQAWGASSFAEDSFPGYA